MEECSFGKVAGLLKVTLLYGYFSRFVNCTNGTKLHINSPLTYSGNQLIRVYMIGPLIVKPFLANLPILYPLKTQ